MTLTTTQIEQLISATRQTAKTEILPWYRRLDDSEIDTKAHAQDLVTKADKASERALTDLAAEILPGAVVVGEEAVSDGSVSLDALKGAEQALIIDPIDGTWNYANGLNTFGVILAVVENGETIFGLLYDPMGDDWVMAERGGGAVFARADGTQRAAKARAPRQVNEMTGYWPPSLFDTEARGRLYDFAKGIDRMGSLRCACHEYRLFSHGGADFLLTGNLNPWDHAAGALIAREAGGYVKMLDGEAYAPTLTEGSLLVAPDRDSWMALADPLRMAVFGD